MNPTVTYPFVVKRDMQSWYAGITEFVAGLVILGIIVYGLGQGKAPSGIIGIGAVIICIVLIFIGGYMLLDALTFKITFTEEKTIEVRSFFKKRQFKAGEMVYALTKEDPRSKKDSIRLFDADARYVADFNDHCINWAWAHDFCRAYLTRRD